MAAAPVAQAVSAVPSRSSIGGSIKTTNNSAVGMVAQSLGGAGGGGDSRVVLRSRRLEQFGPRGHGQRRECRLDHHQRYEFGWPYRPERTLGSYDGNCAALRGGGAGDRNGCRRQHHQRQRGNECRRGFPDAGLALHNTAPNNALATAVGLSDRSSLNAVLGGNPNNFAKWSPVGTFVAGEGLLGAIAPGGIAHSFDTKVDFTFTIPSGYGSNLTIGLLNGTAFNAAAFDPGHDSLTLTITDNANVIFSDSFLSLLDAVNFFTADVLTLGTIFGVSNNIGIDLALVSSDNAGFLANVVVGTVPEPASWLLFGTGLVLLVVYGRRSRRASAAA